MRGIAFLTLSILLFSCGAEADSSATTTEDETVIVEVDSSDFEEVPAIEGNAIQSDFEIENFDILEKITGDLNKDGQDETVVAYDTGVEDVYGNNRVIYIYKKNDDGEWVEWSASSSAIMNSGSGGMMGDGFDGMEIKNGVLIVRHWGGSREKWSYTHKYRFQNDDFYLIGVTTNTGAPCEYWEDFDYNLSTGKINFKREIEECPDEGILTDLEEFNSDFEIKLDILPKFSEIELTSTKVIDPYTGETCYY